MARHPSVRTSATTENLVQIINRLRADVAKLRGRFPPFALAFTTAGVASGVACTSATFVDTHTVLLKRVGRKVVVDVLAGTGAGSVMEARLSVPDLGLTGAAVASGTGGEQRIQVTLTLPDTWPAGEEHLVNVQARRVSGADATTVRIARVLACGQIFPARAAASRIVRV